MSTRIKLQFLNYQTFQDELAAGAIKKAYFHDILFDANLVIDVLRFS